MARIPLVLIHGYSDKGESFHPWRDELVKRGRDVRTINIGTYQSLTNEVTIRDVAEGLDRALQIQAGLSANEPFDAIVHSTGMLVVRSWLTAYSARRERLKHLVALAPATFGSPLAHKGRSWLGAVFKGNRKIGPDFMEAGDRILDGLELGSRFTWDLAHLDLLGPETYYGPTAKTPYPFVICGTESYGGLRSLIGEDGTDGTVRWAGCALDTRKVVVDLTVDPARATDAERFMVSGWKNVDTPLVAVPGLNHATIMSAPPKALANLVHEALEVSSAKSYKAWHADAPAALGDARPEPWQQFVVHAVDERGDPITDYNIQLLGSASSGALSRLKQFDVDVHVYAADKSFRCFHVNLRKLAPEKLKRLSMRVIASSGSRLVGYHGFGSEKVDTATSKPRSDGTWDAMVDLSAALSGSSFEFFYPFTTTLVELRLDREPLPLTGPNRVFWFGTSPADAVATSDGSDT